MDGNFLVIDKKVLPEVYEKVLQVKKILKEGKIKEITEATKYVGISRSVYYKYKDFVFEFSETNSKGRKVIFSMVVTHRQGVLSSILNLLSNYGGNILTINQGIPINGLAHIIITMDVSLINNEISTMLDSVGEVDGVQEVRFIAME